MLSISPPRSAKDATTYFAAHLQPEAFAAPASAMMSDVSPGTWHGRGAQALGLVGPVTAEVLAPLLVGVDQEGRRLVQNAGCADRRSAWDLVWSSPKSVSVAWALGDREQSVEIEAAHRAAVVHAIDEMEARFGIGRRGKGGRRKEPAALVIACFGHHTSRANDPQLHDHAMLINLAGFADGRWGALETRPLFQATLAIGADYRTELASRLRAMGMPLETDGESFRIATVPRRLDVCFSRRRQQIQAQLNAWGRHSARASEAATLMTRTEKHPVPLAQLRHLWRLRAAASGSSEIQTMAEKPGLPDLDPPDPKDWLQFGQSAF